MSADATLELERATFDTVHAHGPDGTPIAAPEQKRHARSLPWPTRCPPEALLARDFANGGSTEGAATRSAHGSGDAVWAPPASAFQRLHEAHREADQLWRLLSLLEAREHLQPAERVARPIATAASSRPPCPPELRAHLKRQQLRDVCGLMTTGLDALTERVARERRTLAEATALAREWHVVGLSALPAAHAAATSNSSLRHTLRVELAPKPPPPAASGEQEAAPAPAAGGGGAARDSGSALARSLAPSDEGSDLSVEIELHSDDSGSLKLPPSARRGADLVGVSYGVECRRARLPFIAPAAPAGDDSRREEAEGTQVRSTHRELLAAEFSAASRALYRTLLASTGKEEKGAPAEGALLQAQARSLLAECSQVPTHCIEVAMRRWRGEGEREGGEGGEGGGGGEGGEGSDGGNGRGHSGYYSAVDVGILSRWHAHRGSGGGASGTGGELQLALDAARLDCMQRKLRERLDGLAALWTEPRLDVRWRYGGGGGAEGAPLVCTVDLKVMCRAAPHAAAAGAAAWQAVCALSATLSGGRVHAQEQAGAPPITPPLLPPPAVAAVASAADGVSALLAVVHSALCRTLLHKLRQMVEPAGLLTTYSVDGASMLVEGPPHADDGTAWGGGSGPWEVLTRPPPWVRLGLSHLPAGDFALEVVVRSAPSDGARDAAPRAVDLRGLRGRGELAQATGLVARELIAGTS